MTFDELLEHVNKRLHGCVFCGLGKTEAIEFPKEYADDLYKALLSSGVKFVMSDCKVVLFTTGIQLDKFFDDRQV